MAVGVGRGGKEASEDNDAAGQQLFMADVDTQRRSKSPLQGGPSGFYTGN